MEKVTQHRSLKLSSPITKILCQVLRGYAWFVSPWLGRNCRFYPSCSRYAEQALQQYGLWQGCKLALARILRCHPWHEGGVDEVPKKQQKRASWSYKEPSC